MAETRIVHPRKLSPPDEMRMLVGVVVQPFLVGGIAFVLFPVFGLSGGAVDVTDAARAFAIGAGVVALFVTVVGALPAAVWLTKRRHVSFSEALLCGLAFGLFTIVLPRILFGRSGGGDAGNFVRIVALSSLLGATGAGVFWAIAIRRRHSN
jgi:hypothetical protein